MSIQLVSMALVSRNPAPFGDAFTWKVVVKVHDALPKPIDVVVTWVADVTDSTKDIVLDELEVGPFAVGTNSVELENDAPDFDDIDQDTVLGDTCMTVSMKYDGNEFLHVGWPVRVGWADPDHEINIPDVMLPELLIRDVVDKKHVRQPQIDWGLAAPVDDSEGLEDDDDDDNDVASDDELRNDSSLEAAAVAESPAAAPTPASAKVGDKRERSSSAVKVSQRSQPAA